MKIFVAGHLGMVGSALVRRLQSEPGVAVVTRSRREGLDLTDRTSVDAFYASEKPDVAIIAAAKVGGIHANNTYPADFLHENLAIATHSIEGAFRHGVKRLLFLGSSCIYPKFAPQPMPEDCLLTGALEPTNEAYAIAKIAGLKLAQAYRKQHGVLFHSAMPTNLYGPGDNYHPENSHVIPALIRKFHEAKAQNKREVEVWGSGTPRREFLYSEDMADACVFLMKLPEVHFQSRLGHEEMVSNRFKLPLVNIGVGTDITIKELAEAVKKTVGYQGGIAFDTKRPDGTPRKLMDVSILNGIGWRAGTPLSQGLSSTLLDFLKTTE